MSDLTTLANLEAWLGLASGNADEGLLAHLITAVLLAVTIIGLPFAWAHLKLAGLALWPIGREIITTQEAAALRFS